MVIGSLKSVAAVAAAAMVVACAGERQSAQEAVTAAEQAVEALRAEGEALVPAEFDSVTDALADARTRFDAEQYDSAQVVAEQVSQEVAELQATLPAKREELTSSWAAMADSVPAMLAALEAELDQLTKARRLPAGLTREAVADAQALVDSLEQTWGQASGAQSAGRLAEAVSLAASLKARASDLSAMLKM